MKINGWVVVGLLGTTGCGPLAAAGFTGNQADAVTAVVEYTCDAHERCSEVLTGKAYLDRRVACEEKYEPIWRERFPVDDCDKRINKDKLEVCLNAIKAASCDTIEEQLNTAYESCPMSDVCSGR